MPYEFKAPLAVKILFGAIAIGLILYNIVYPFYRSSKNKRAFYEQSFSVLVIKSNSYQGRSVEYHLENGLKIYFLPPVDGKIMIGDSVRKEKNTYQYEVYRKNDEGVYVFFATYNIERIR
jgi:hypothetical protein